MSFTFDKKIDPKNPRDIADQPPTGWDLVDGRDYSKAFHGYPSPLFVECREWQERELARLDILGEVD